jgi:hypothetical protein
MRDLLFTIIAAIPLFIVVIQLRSASSISISIMVISDPTAKAEKSTDGSSYQRIDDQRT